MDELVEKIARAIEKGEKRWIGIDPGSPAFCRNAAQAALAAIRETHAIVPKEPTQEMVDRGYMASERLPTDTVTSPYARTYRAMIEAASPQSPPANP